MKAFKCDRCEEFGLFQDRETLKGTVVKEALRLRRPRPIVDSSGIVYNYMAYVDKVDLCSVCVKSLKMLLWKWWNPTETMETMVAFESAEELVELVESFGE